MHFITATVLSIFAAVGTTASLPPPDNYGVWRNVTLTTTRRESIKDRSDTVTAEYTHPELLEPIYATCHSPAIASGEDFVNFVCHPWSFYFSLNKQESDVFGNLQTIYLSQRVEVAGKNMTVSGTSQTFRQSCGGGNREVCLARDVVVVADKIVA